MIDMFGSADCVGCTACVNACPKHSITMQSDAAGFCYPVVDSKLCVECGLCRNVCPVKQPAASSPKPIRAFGAVNRREEQRLDSSSGGVFSLLAEYILDQGGVVFGAAFSDDFKSVNHIAVQSGDDLDKLRGSKYLQSQIGNAYAETAAFLKQGRCVLFTGTPCQIGGLRAFLGRDYDQLYTQSIACHGVCSPMVWKQYAIFREKSAGAPLSGVSFRKKTPSWKCYSLEMTFENGTKYVRRATEDEYLRCFLRDLTLRPSCFQCQFKGEQDKSDITLADFWGIGQVLPKLDDGKGTSLVLTRTEKGQYLLNACKVGMKVEAADYIEAIRENSAMVQSAKMPKKRSRFMEEIENQPVEIVLHRYGRKTGVDEATTRLRWYCTKIKRVLRRYKR